MSAQSLGSPQSTLAVALATAAEQSMRKGRRVWTASSWACRLRYEQSGSDATASSAAQSESSALASGTRLELGKWLELTIGSAV